MVQFLNCKLIIAISLSSLIKQILNTDRSSIKCIKLPNLSLRDTQRIPMEKNMEGSDQKATDVVEKNVVTVATQQPSEKKSNMIQVSSNKRPLYFYVNLAKVLPSPFIFLFFFSYFHLSTQAFMPGILIKHGWMVGYQTHLYFVSFLLQRVRKHL